MDFAFLRNAPQPLRFVIIFVGLDRLFAAAGSAEIVRALGINREEAHRCAVFGRHVRDGRAVHEWQRRRAGAEKFHELADDFRLAKNLRDRERDIRGGNAFTNRSRQWTPTTSGVRK